MTCVVGLKTKDGILIGADSQATNRHHRHFRSDPKVFRNGSMILGYTTSFRMGQLLEYKLSLPPREVGQDVMRYMCGPFIDAVRHTFKDAGFARNDNGVETGGTFLAGFEGELFEIDEDYQVARCVDGYAAVGSGFSYALGVLHATKGEEPEKRVRMALEAASYFNVTVGGEITILTEFRQEAG
ncbi:hypothetical protein [Defluviimonas sp. SAOS-178_SWC]|uniref:hypothetical protein n=1 Tax=Defluviimonas sp. SAOS-178_SWC TaxID=3121287 RepID=UPI0032220A22